MKKNKWLYGILLALSAISFQANAQSATATDCTNPDKKDSRDSTCVTGVGLTSVAPPPPASSFQSKSTKPFQGSGTACTTPWGSTVAHNSAVAAYNQAFGSYDPVTGEFGAGCLEETRHCYSGTLSGSYEYESCGLAPVNGSCGPANGAYYIYPSSGPAFADQCNPSYVYGGMVSTSGPPSVVASSGVVLSGNTFTWTCAGENGGTTSTCMAYRRVNGQCGAATNTCNLGSPGGYSTSSSYASYSCNCTTAWYDSDGDSWIAYDPDSIHNSLYTIWGYTLSSHCDTCYSPTPTTTNNWICYGFNGGSNASCSN